MNWVKIGIVFLISFVIQYSIYYFCIIKKCKKKKGYVPVEVNLILMKKRIDTTKIDLYQMIKVVSLVTVIILSTAITFVLEFSLNIIISMFVATIISLVIALISYNIIGNYYKNKSRKKVK